MRLRFTLAFLVCALLTPLAHADPTTYDYTGSAFTDVGGTWTTNYYLTGTVTLSSALTGTMGDQSTGSYVAVTPVSFDFKVVDGADLVGGAPAVIYELTDANSVLPADFEFSTVTGQITGWNIFIEPTVGGYYASLGTATSSCCTGDFAGDGGPNYGYNNSFSPSDWTLDTGSVAPTPEPGSFALLGTGLLGVAGVVRRRYLKV